MRYRETVEGKTFLDKTELTSMFDVGVNIDTNFNWLVFEIVEGMKVCVGDSSVIAKISLEELNKVLNKKTGLTSLNNGECGHITLLTETIWINAIESLRKTYSDEQIKEKLHLNPLANMGSGSWCYSKGKTTNVCGYGGVDGSLTINPLTKTNDYGWRPVIIIVDN